MKRRRKARAPETFELLELQLAVLQHCNALGAVTHFLEQGKTDAAIARLDAAISAFQSIIRGQCIGQTKACPICGTTQEVVAWVDSGTCNYCGHELKWPRE